jgi:peptidoglycan/xylan/chitin deacetylase (PgdA/CDA1 family)
VHARPRTSPAPSPDPATPGPDIRHGSRTRHEVALTFHGAGDAGLARRVLRTLGPNPVTVMAVGSWLEADPGLADAILHGGHDLGNHTYHHLAMRTLGAGQARTEIARCADVLQRLTGSPGTWFRPSGTQASTPTIRSAALRSGYGRCLSYDVDSGDWLDPGAPAIVRNVLASARPGSIVSLHLGHPGTLEALPRLLDGLSARGLRPVTVTQMLQ